MTVGLFFFLIKNLKGQRTWEQQNFGNRKRKVDLADSRKLSLKRVGMGAQSDFVETPAGWDPVAADAAGGRGRGGNKRGELSESWIQEQLGPRRPRVLTVGSLKIAKFSSFIWAV